MASATALKGSTRHNPPLLLTRVGRLNQGFNFPNLCAHDPTDRFGLARVEPVLEISVPVARRAARAFSPTMHSAPGPSPYSRLPAGVPSAGLGPTAAGFS